MRRELIASGRVPEPRAPSGGQPERGRSETLPIVFLTSRDDEFDRVLGLELGADDYLCKPFSMRELVARVKVLMRRLALMRSNAAPDEAQLMHAGRLVLDLQRYTAQWHGEAVALTVTEFQLERALARSPGHVKTRRQLMEEGYPHDAFVSADGLATMAARRSAATKVIDSQKMTWELPGGIGPTFDAVKKNICSVFGAAATIGIDTNEL